ncbi:MAG: UDP-N-acetylmuramoyl-L-alanyl-D-glutamate--2,6-diaminopimelate ligase [Syntrophorhabdales bacterium]|jgi:UDP-N-acetylmuramoyl-L-alanyl-D-glutamate--2,6-diaminopimelate ligase
MKLRELLAGMPVIALTGDPPGGQEITGITKDSREVREGFMFFATGSGTSYLADALTNRASVIVSEGPLPVDVPCHVVTRDARQLLARVAARFYGLPSRTMHVTGITGTNGKTTVSYLIESILRASGRPAGVIGTISYRYNNHVRKGPNTTPGSVEIQSLLSDMKEEGVRYAVMEVSSHALDQSRVDGVDFDCAIFTNLTHDHLDYHGDAEHYRRAKALLFHRCLRESAKERKYAVINIDDPSAASLIPAPPVTTLTYGTSARADAYATSIDEDIDGLTVSLSVCGARVEVSTPMVGLFNVSNILAAALFGHAAHAAPEAVASGIASLAGVPGRLERVATDRGFHVFVDYAHTPDALQKTMETLNRVRAGRLIVVFGCGGDRDRTKRPVMGRIASTLSDVAIITSDNPRTEEPLSIIEEIKAGITGNGFTTIEDRKAAIAEAIAMAKEKDVVLVAGKGHEDYQIIGKVTYPFSDREVIEEYLRVAS